MRTRKKSQQLIVWKQNEKGVREERHWNTLLNLCEINYSNLHNKYTGLIIRDLIDETDFKQKIIENILGVGRTAYFKTLKKDFLDVSQVDVLSSFAKVYRQGLEAFEYDADDLEMFLNMSNKNLGNVIPRELLYSESGRRALSEAFNRIKYGIYG